MPIKTTYKGKPFDPEEWKNDMVGILLNNIRNWYVERIASVLTEEEQAQVTVEIVEKENGKYACAVSSPEELKERIAAVIYQQS